MNLIDMNIIQSPSSPAAPSTAAHTNDKVSSKTEPNSISTLLHAAAATATTASLSAASVSTANTTPSSIPSTAKQFNQYACIRCRKLKKKCSKELPRCLNCEKQSECCEYVERKNKRKSFLNSKAISKKLKLDSNGTDFSDGLIMEQRRHTTTFQPNLNVNQNLSLSSPRSNLIQLPPIRSRSTSMNQYSKLNGNNNMNTNISHLPSLSSYSLHNTLASNNNHSSNSTENPSISVPLQILDQHSTNLPSVPRQLWHSKTTSLPDPNSIINNIHKAERRDSKSSINSLSSQNNKEFSTFLAPSNHQLFTDEILNNVINDSRDQQTISLPILNDMNESHILFATNSSNSIEFDLLILSFNKIGFLDENIFTTFINNDINLNYRHNLLIILNLIIFVDSSVILKNLKDFEENNFNYSGKYKSSEDYFSSIEFLLVFTCSIILTNYQHNITDLKFQKFTFTMAYKLLQKKYFKMSNIQILRLFMLILIISFLSNSNFDNLWFIQSIVSKLSIKWSLNKNLKKLNLKNITLSELEYSNRLFWLIFITDSLISSTIGNQSTFKLNDIDVPLPIPITKDEEVFISIQNIIINMSKIQLRILSELYVVSAKQEINNSDSERFVILSSLRQEADIWYNDCRIVLSKLSDLNNKGTSTHILSNINLQNLAAWISQEYYYTLTQLFKPSNLFTNPDIPNFRVISNTAFQNTNLLLDLLNNKIILPTDLIFLRYSNISFYVLISIYKGMFTANECHSIFKNMIEIWTIGYNASNKEDPEANFYLEFLNKITEFFKFLNPTVDNFKKANTGKRKLNEFDDDEDEDDLILNKFKPNDDIKKIILRLIKEFGLIMEKKGISVSIDLDYLKSSVSLE